MDDMSKEGNSKLVDQILDASTEPEIEAARKEALKHLKAHPDDMTVRFAMEQLAMIAAAR